MSDKKRNRRSKVQMLPEDLKEQLDQMLRDGRLGQQEITDIVNSQVEEAGLPDSTKISQPGLSRYASRMEKIGARIRQSREVAEVWTAKLGSEPTSEVGKLLQEVVRTMAFDTGMHMSESDKPVEPKALSQLALAIQRIEQAALTGHKREKEIRTAFAEEAANAVSEELRGQDGMSEQLEDRIKKVLLGKA